MMQKPSGYWKDWSNFEREMREAIEKNGGEFPTETEIRKMKISGLANAISRHYGGISAVRERMGHDLETKPRGYWKDPDNFKRELREAISENGGEFPTQNRLIEMGKMFVRNSASGKWSNANILKIVRDARVIDWDSLYDALGYDWNSLEEQRKSELSGIIDAALSELRSAGLIDYKVNEGIWERGIWIDGNIEIKEIWKPIQTALRISLSE